MGLTDKRERSGGSGQALFGKALSGKTLASRGLAICLVGSALMAAPMPARAGELSTQLAALYATVSIFPPSAKSMTVCYGFVCRRREILDFTPGDRNALTQILSAGKSSAAAERAVV